MPTQPCNNDKKIAQTLFLGASVANFNTSLGWGIQPSQLTVNLIEDKVSPFCDKYGQPISSQFPRYSGKVIPNHYHDCLGDDCYMIADGSPFDSSKHAYSDRLTLGKVYYKIYNNPPVSPKSNKSNCVLSEYWVHPDPGFIGIQNRLNLDGTYINIYEPLNENLNPGYDIINCPVFFKVGDFSFGGMVQSWNRSQSNAGDVITVNINDMKSVLSNCYIILDKFSGAIYSKVKDVLNFYGGPRNWAGDQVDYFGRLYHGNVPNVFNIYGFLESFGTSGFGGSNKNKNGISVNSIVDALTVLSSNIPIQNDLFQSLQTGYAPKSAFSPFCRILTKTPQTSDTFQNISSAFNSFGIIPPTLNLSDNIDRCQFVLDLSEIPRFSDNFRLADPVISITDFISRICEESGHDFLVDCHPIVMNGYNHNVIKIKLISRNAQPSPIQIESSVNQLLCDGYSVSSATYGKEKNETNLKSVVIGANQQRLLQVRSNRLAYTQTNLVFNSRTMEFVNYDTLGNSPISTYRFHHGQYRFPSAFSTNNPDLSKQINPNQSDLYDSNEVISNTIAKNDFSSIDSRYRDPLSAPNPQNCGNYYSTTNIPQSVPVESNDPGNYWGFNSGNVLGQTLRFFPMFKDAICPFFGFVRDEEIKIDTSQKNTDYRKIRPVYLDTWTGQICVLVQVHEFPQVSLDIIPTIVSDGKGYILISESEIRAALAGFDNFLVYCLAKQYRPDLLESVRLGHQQKYYNKLLSEGISPAKAADMAKKKYDWFWRQVHGNIAGPFGQPVEIAPAKNDGASYIDQNAMQDLQILHQFVNQIGSYYGKQYMVSLPNLESYKDSQYSGISLPTAAGDCYVFSGDGDVYYNYEPISEGAWEEPGNIIDDAIAVGGNNYYALSEQDGRIGAILGYNTNKYFDYTKAEMCRFAQNLYNNNLAALDDQKINPAWSYQIFDEILNIRETSCPEGGFVYNNVNIAALPTTDYVTTTSPGATVAQDAWAYSIQGEPIRKTYVKAQVDPKINYIDSRQFLLPKAIVTSPGLTLNTSSSQYKKDPNRTVVCNVSSEDLIMYMKTTNEKYWDYEFIAYLLYYISPVFQNIFKGNYAVSSDESANHVEIAPKAANPFFAGIPIRLNNAVYGPWSNNIYVDYLRSPDSIFPPGTEIKTSDTPPYACTAQSITINPEQAKSLIDNFIGPTSIEVDEQMAPWNFGGSAYMDQVANIQAYSKLNYQNIIESAQISMPGLPLFDLGSEFGVSAINNRNIDLNNLISTNNYRYTDQKFIYQHDILDNFSWIDLPNKLVPNLGSMINNRTTSNIDAYYNAIVINTPISKPSTVITNIQVNIGSDGINTTYSLRTYTRKLSLFNKTEIDRISKQGQERIQRSKQIASIKQQNRNIEIQQYKTREDRRLTESNSYFDSIGFSSKLFGWSPTTVLLGQASPYLKSLNTTPDYIPPDSLYVKPEEFASLGQGRKRYDLPSGKSLGDDETTKDPELLQNSDTFMLMMQNTTKYKTDVGMYELKEIRAQLDQDYGMQSAMSLDGILSPVSFYPTNKNSTYSYAKYDAEFCPFCRGSKKIKTEYKWYTNTDTSSITEYIYCDRCERKDKKLKYSLASSGGGAGSSEVLPPYIVSNLSTLTLLEQFKSFGGASSSQSSQSGGGSSINLISLNPVLSAQGDFRNPNTQNYVGEHPDGKHPKLTIGGKDRPFIDRCRHSIEIVGRGSIPQQNITITDNTYEYIDGYQPDFHNEDLALMDNIKERNTGAIPLLDKYQMNQRFMGLRGPLTMHAWGYDTEGYPVPNAADEPLSVDKYGRPLRFKLKIKSITDTTYGEATDGSVYLWAGKFYVKGEEQTSPSDDTKIQVYVYENDLSSAGYITSEDYSSDRTKGYQGDIVSKTQTLQDNGQYSKKIKLDDFYLNFGERPDLWPVGPIDLRWDTSRKVWTVPTSANIYKMVYVTLEEDMIKPADHYDETFAARGFLDELEYNTEPLPNGSRRLVYIKDKTGWTAPRGAKLLCRYNSDTGFYEPVSKPSFTVVGTILNNQEANISLKYVQGKNAGSIPTMKVTFRNSLNLTYASGANGFFIYESGQWTLFSVG